MKFVYHLILNRPALLIGTFMIIYIKMIYKYSNKLINLTIYFTNMYLSFILKPCFHKNV